MVQREPDLLCYADFKCTLKRNSTSISFDIKRNEQYGAGYATAVFEVSKGDVISFSENDCLIDCKTSRYKNKIR